MEWALFVIIGVLVIFLSISIRKNVKNAKQSIDGTLYIFTYNDRDNEIYLELHKEIASIIDKKNVIFTVTHK